MWCTPQSLTPQYDAHCGVGLHSKMHTTACVTRFLPSSFFHDLNPSGPLTNRLKYFQIRFQFHQDIQNFTKLHSVHHTLKSITYQVSDSAVCIIPQSRGYQAPQLHHTVESSSAVCIIPPGLGIRSFQKNVLFFAFFSVLLKRTFRSLHSFPFF